MAATMNIFEYFHYMTSFIDELVEKHGYDRDVIVNAWRSQNEKWMMLEKSKAVTEMKKTSTKKRVATKEATEKCSFILTMGKNQGTRCTKNALADTKMCKTHVLKTSSDDDDKPLVVKKNTSTKIANLKSTQNRANACGKNVSKAGATAKKITDEKSDDDEKSDNKDDKEMANEGDDDE